MRNMSFQLQYHNAHTCNQLLPRGSLKNDGSPQDIYQVWPFLSLIPVIFLQKLEVSFNSKAFLSLVALLSPRRSTVLIYIEKKKG